MRKRVILKRIIKNKIYFYITITMLLLCAFMQMNNKDKEKVAIYSSDDSFSSYLDGRIQDSIFDYSFVHDSDEVAKLINSGKADYGFDFSPNYDRLIAENKLDNSIAFYSTPNSLLTEVVKEEVFSYWIAYYSDSINKYYLMEAFEDANSNELVETKNKYLLGDTLLDVNIVMNEKINTVVEKHNNIIRGIVALCIFTVIYLANSYFYNGDEAKIYNSVIKKDAYNFRLVCLIVSCIIVTLAGEIFIVCTNNYYEVLLEGIKIFGLIILSIIWSLMISKMAKTEETYMAFLPSMIIVQLMICPVILDIGKYILIFRYIKYILPAGLFI